MKLIFCCVVLATLQAVPALAQESSDSPSAQKPKTATEERKAKTIESIITAINVEKLLKETHESLDKDKEKRVERMLDKLVKDGRIKPEQRDRMLQSMQKSDRPKSTRGSEFIKQLEIPQFINHSYTTLLDRFFTEKELKDILRFVNSSTGKKLRTVAPQMTSDSVDLAVEYFTPKIAEQISKMRGGRRGGSRIETMPELRRYREEMLKQLQEHKDGTKVPEVSPKPEAEPAPIKNKPDSELTPSPELPPEKPNTPSSEI